MGLELNPEADAQLDPVESTVSARSGRMSAPNRIAVVAQPVAVTRTVAAAMLGMSPTTFENRVQPEVAIVRLGSLRLVPVSELHRWAAENARQVL